MSPVKACPKDGHPYYVGRCPECARDKEHKRGWAGRRKTKSGWEWGRIREQVRRRDRACVVCGRTDDRLEVHHIRPLAEGGTNNLANLELRCSAHHTHTPARPQEAV